MTDLLLYLQDANGDTFPGPVVGSGVSPACQLATLTWMFCLVVRAEETLGRPAVWLRRNMSNGYWDRLSNSFPINFHAFRNNLCSK